MNESLKAQQVCVCVCVWVCLFQIEKLCLNRAARAETDSESPKRSCGKHAGVPLRSHYNLGVQVSVGTTRAFLESFLSLQAQHLSTCVCQQFLCFSSQMFFILEDLTRNLLNFHDASFLHDHANRKVFAPIINCMCIDTFAQSLLTKSRQNWDVYPEDGP